MKSIALLALLGASLTLSACGPNAGTRALSGGTAGAVVGGPVGAVAGGTLGATGAVQVR